MTTRRHLGFVAAGATLMASFPLSLIFEQWTWAFFALIVVGMVAGGALIARTLRARPLFQAGAMVLGLLISLTWLFPNGSALLGLVPMPDTFVYFAHLLTQAGTEMRENAPPVHDLDGLLFLCVLGVGLVAVITDLVAVTLRRPALAGLPMLAIYSVPVAVYSESIPVLPFIVGAVGFLWLLVSDSVDRVRRFGRRFTGEGRDVDVWEPSPLASAGRRLAIVGVVTAILLPMAMPTFGGGWFGEGVGSGDGEGGGPGRGGGPGSVNLFAELSGRLNQIEVQDLARVTTNDPSPYYLRFGIADELTDNGFKTRTPSGQQIGGANLPNPLDREQRQGVERRQFQAKVEITGNFNMPMLPVYAEPISTKQIDSSWSYDPNMGIVFSTRSRSTNKRYEFDFVRSTYTADALRTAQQLSVDSSIRRQFAHVPVVPEVKQQADKLVTADMTQYDKVRAIFDFFSSKNGFRYDTTTVAGTSGNKMVDFLKARVGFCEQYAAALAWMIRSVNIPARVAFGFTRGNNPTQNGVYTLTNHNLHAWTEVYFDGFGWVPFDATPASNVAGSVSPPWAPDVNAPTPSDGPTDPGASIDPNEDLPGAGPRPDRNPNDLDGELGGDAAAKAPVWPWYVLGGVILLLLFLISPAIRRTLLRRRRSAAVAELGDATEPLLTRDGSPAAPGVEIFVGGDEVTLGNYRRRAHAAWDELMDTLVDFRVEVDRSDTPRMVAARLIEEQVLGETAASAAKLLAWAEERARYALTPLAPVGLSDALIVVRRTLSESATRQTRMVAFLAPPSVVGRWRTSFLNSSTGVITGIGRFRDLLVRYLSPRRLLSR
ncbi:transglutaminase-like putative cysteine protease/uncharacterized membrane protein YhaH (DUF805 family) [Allocatelliglobosispora scoriae]|uniref:Transglutaminase-like putative cysteine protease/uncharacterized membrane protein YhaH (DUF805 family) n=1 Tax=Allocatelliglobosispora scoriae TaxID=643052 RepID=A0A841BRG4_9ACTN|nr:DUF3488 and transglutaminase-like domain-containing protein [Allocatelliglobosispora scoriae]MBB5869390.1 transglutaminase-like putative cysteine protease/uncharacterized membrane protein YhaH (DUF805 family) [Allocatelliglobosispora scoriae]